MSLRGKGLKKLTNSPKNAIFCHFKVDLRPWAKVKVIESHILLKITPQTALGPSFLTLLQLLTDILAIQQFKDTKWERRGGRGRPERLQGRENLHPAFFGLFGHRPAHKTQKFNFGSQGLRDYIPQWTIWPISKDFIAYLKSSYLWVLTTDILAYLKRLYCLSQKLRKGILA